jgi:hypothetical protein
MFVSPASHLRHQLCVSFSRRLGVNQPSGDIPRYFHPCVQAAGQHMKFQVLAKQVIAAQYLRLNHPHSHDMLAPFSRKTGSLINVLYCNTWN